MRLRPHVRPAVSTLLVAAGLAAPAFGQNDGSPTAPTAGPTAAASPESKPRPVADAPANAPETTAPTSTAAKADPAATVPRPTLLVLALQDEGDEVASSVERVLNERLGRTLSSLGSHEVITAGDLNTLATLEADKAALGCTEGASCLAELANAFGARFVVSGDLAVVGDTTFLYLTLLDVERAKADQRIELSARDPVELADQLSARAPSLLGVPRPDTPQPERGVGFWGVGALGAGAVGALGALLGGALTTGGYLGFRAAAAAPAPSLSDLRGAQSTVWVGLVVTAVGAVGLIAAGGLGVVALGAE